jgi:hypothetical protein
MSDEQQMDIACRLLVASCMNVSVQCMSKVHVTLPVCSQSAVETLFQFAFNNSFAGVSPPALE